jgi:transcriptional regulator with XRE-family HTH domain
MNELKFNIKKRRKQLGLTLKKLGDQIGVSSSYLSQIETGKIIPSMLSLKKIADTLHTTIGVMVGESQLENNSIIIRRNDRKQLNDYKTDMLAWIPTLVF